MKTIKKHIFLLLVLFTGISIITSCSKDEETTQNAKVNNYF